MPKPHVSVTCLLTRARPPGVHERSQSLYRGLNFVTVCVTLSAAFMGYKAVRQLLWIEGKDILPGAKTYASEACKVVYQQIPDAQEILKCCGKLKGLISKCPYLSMSGGSHGGTKYLLKLDKDMFATLVLEKKNPFKKRWTVVDSQRF